jgi:tRNA threonylcarbamoyladenosine biosynthesis protein TsaB
MIPFPAPFTQGGCYQGPADKVAKVSKDLTVLALDCSAGACSVAVLRGGVCRARHFEEMTRGHAEALLPFICATLKDAGLDFCDLDRVAATVGPGSFTGLRIGLAAARGIGLAANIPVIGVSTLEALAYGIGEPELAGREVLAVLDTKRGDLYGQRFDTQLRPLGPPFVISPAAALSEPHGPLVVVGDGAAQLRAEISAEAAGGGSDILFSDVPGVPDAFHVARIAARQGMQGSNAYPPTPLYLRPPQARRP